MLWDASARTRPPPPAPEEAHAAPRDGPEHDLRGGAAERELRRFVRAHEVCWESHPRVELRAGRRHLVGYDVRLFARHPRGLGADPAAPESRRLQEQLADVAAHVCPPEWPTGLSVRFQPDPARLLLRPENEWVPEIAGCLTLQHSGATFGAADDAQKRCVHEIEARLAELGARPRTWRAS
jgi:hypothetical protein